MRTLHPAYRITDLATSLAFYGAIGFEQVGRVDLGDGVTFLSPTRDVVGPGVAVWPGAGQVSRLQTTLKRQKRGPDPTSVMDQPKSEAPCELTETCAAR